MEILVFEVLHVFQVFRPVEGTDNERNDCGPVSGELAKRLTIFMKLVRDLSYPFGEPPRRWPGQVQDAGLCARSKIAEI